LAGRQPTRFDFPVVGIVVRGMKVTAPVVEFDDLLQRSKTACIHVGGRKLYIAESWCFEGSTVGHGILPGIETRFQRPIYKETLCNTTRVRECVVRARNGRIGKSATNAEIVGFRSYPEAEDAVIGNRAGEPLRINSDYAIYGHL